MEPFSYTGEGASGWPCHTAGSRRMFWLTRTRYKDWRRKAYCAACDNQAPKKKRKWSSFLILKTSAMHHCCFLAIRHSSGVLSYAGAFRAAPTENSAVGRQYLEQ